MNMPAIGLIQFPIQVVTGRQATALKIVTALRRAYIRSMVMFGEMMEQWAYNNVPIDLGKLISDFVSTVRSSSGVGAFVMGNPNTDYASYVNEMRNVQWKRWGRNPAKDAYFDRSLMFASRAIPLCIHRAIVAEGIDAKIGVPAVQIMNTYFQFQRP